MRTKHTITRSTTALVGLGFGLSLGCLSFRANPDHCSNLEGDATCASLYGSDRPFCSWGRDACESAPAADGCVEAQPIDACYSPCGGTALLEDDASCIGATSSSSDDATSTDPSEGSTTSMETADSSGSSTTGPMPCLENEDCDDPGAPFCEPVSGECVTCAATADPDGACAGSDPTAPLCVDAACVQCTAENTAVCDELHLLCDDESHVCVPCAAHEQCASGACDLAVGQCFPDGLVVHVDGDGGADFMTVTAAVADVADGADGIIVVHELDSGAPYVGSVLLDGGKRIALLGATGETAIIQGIGVSPGLRIVEGSTTAYVDGLELSNATATGVVVDGAFAWFDRTRIVGNDGGGILAQNGAQLTLRNCFAGGNVEADVLELQASSADVIFTTLGAGLGVTTSISCDAVGTANVRNSLIVSRSDEDEVACGNVDATYTASETMLDGTGNVALGAMVTTWFTDFNGGDFHLTTAPAVVGNTAQWEAGDPAIDIDGDDRPSTDGASDFAGADRP